MFKNKKEALGYFFIGCGSIGALGLFIYLTFLKPEPAVPYDNVLIDAQITRLKTENAQLRDSISVYVNIASDFLNQIDSLENRKPIIEIKYVTKYKEIDDASVITVVSELDSLFSGNR